MLDGTQWPSIEMQALAGRIRQRYQQRSIAIERYERGFPISEAAEAP
jgi:hypothetical protein